MLSALTLMQPDRCCVMPERGAGLRHAGAVADRGAHLKHAGLLQLGQVRCPFASVAIGLSALCIVVHQREKVFHAPASLCGLLMPAAAIERSPSGYIVYTTTCGFGHDNCSAKAHAK